MNLHEFFYIQRSDRKVFFFVLALAAVAGVAFHFVGGMEQKTKFTVSNTDTTTTSIANTRHKHTPAPRYYQPTDGITAELFAFDPNTADSTQLLRLGLQPWQVRNIYRYRARGGVYRRSEDFARLYGLTKKQYRELKPYIQISDDYRPAAELVAQQTKNSHEAANYKPYKEYDRDTIRYPLKIQPGETVNLATADTTMLKKVPGIGSSWARRIVSYGEQLGGYVHVGQLKEIDDFPEEALPYFTVRNAHPRRININQLSVNQLRRHPYINFYQARHIVDYRRMKGQITSLQQFALLKDFPPEAISRLEPYVEF